MKYENWLEIVVVLVVVSVITIISLVFRVSNKPILSSSSADSLPTEPSDNICWKTLSLENVFEEMNQECNYNAYPSAKVKTQEEADKITIATEKKYAKLLKAHRAFCELFVEGRAQVPAGMQQGWVWVTCLEVLELKPK